MNFFKDVYRFISYLTFVDVVFFMAIITLLILLVTLIYFIKINKDVIEDDNITDDIEANILAPVNEPPKSEKLNNIVNQIEIKPEVENQYNDEEAPLIDLESLTKKLQDEAQNDRIMCTEYEKDQEDKAIISYDELLQKHNKYSINYEKEEVMDDLVVKKVNLNDLINKEIQDENKAEVRVISYQKEEAFLQALKELNSLLN